MDQMNFMRISLEKKVEGWMGWDDDDDDDYDYGLLGQ